MKIHDFQNTPIYKKAEEILETVKTITDLFPEDDEFLKEIKVQLMSDAFLIPAKLVGAMGAKLYDIKMENATLIRKAARDLMVSYHLLTRSEFKESEYYLLVRKQIEEFRLLFIDWVESFNPEHFITDNWGLFNPPGISPDYEQRTDELNFLDEDDEDDEEWDD